MAKTNIYFVIGSLNRDGASTWLLTMAKYMDRSKFNIHICVFTQIFLNERLDKIIHDLDLKIEVLKAPKHKLNPLYYYKLFRSIKKNKADLVVNCNMQLSGIIRIISKLLFVKNLTVYNNRIDSLKWVIKLQENITRKLSDYFIGCSTSVFRELNDIDTQKKALIFNTELDENNIVDRKKYIKLLNIKEDHKIFLNVARYHPQKNQLPLIKAFNEYLDLFPESYLILVGWGENEELFRNEISKSKNAGKIFLTGPIDDLHNLYDISDFFIMPSLFEGLSIAAVKALKFSLPLIITEIQEFEDVKNHNFIPIRGFDKLSIFNALKIAGEESSEKISLLSNNSRNLYQKRFKPEFMVSEYEKSFVQCIQQK